MLNIFVKLWVWQRNAPKPTEENGRLNNWEKGQTAVCISSHNPKRRPWKVAIALQASPAITCTRSHQAATTDPLFMFASSKRMELAGANRLQADASISLPELRRFDL